MKKINLLLLLCVPLLWIGCSGDEDPPNGGGNGGTPVAEVMVNSTAGGPAMTSATEAVWNSITAATVTINRSGALKRAPDKAAIVAASVDVKAIVSGDTLYMQFVWADDSLHIFKDNWTINDAANVNFTQNTSIAGEDHLLAMFAGLPGDTLDVWHWRALTTGAANLAEGRRWADGVQIIDNGGQEVAFSNTGALNDPRPKWVHTTGAAYTGDILFIEDISPILDHVVGENWVLGQMVPGWFIDSAVYSRVRTSAFRQSQWDIFTVHSYDAVANEYALVMARQLNTGFADDYNLMNRDTVQFKIAIVDNKDALDTGNDSEQGSSAFVRLIF